MNVEYWDERRKRFKQILQMTRQLEDIEKNPPTTEKGLCYLAQLKQKRRILQATMTPSIVQSQGDKSD
jgi:hypothetical protein